MPESPDTPAAVDHVPFSSLFDTPQETLDRYRQIPYEEFLQTTYWATITKHLVTNAGKCQLCSARGNLAVHHNTYEHHGREHLHLEDLTVLCGRCHTYFHRTKQLGNGVPPLYRIASLENFRLPTDNPAARDELSRAYMTVRRWVREYPLNDPPGLLFMGAPGTGKTHLAVAALLGLVARGSEGLFYDCQDLAERLALGMRDGSATAELDACRNAEVLLLDDVGSQRHKDWMEDALLSIVKHRCNHKGPLIVTTSLPDDWALQVFQPERTVHLGYRQTLADIIGAKARSRLFEMCKIIPMPSVADFRCNSEVHPDQ